MNLEYHGSGLRSDNTWALNHLDHDLTCASVVGIGTPGTWAARPVNNAEAALFQANLIFVPWVSAISAMTRV
jgi:hypothetical protein